MYFYMFISLYLYLYDIYAYIVYNANTVFRGIWALVIPMCGINVFIVFIFLFFLYIHLGYVITLYIGITSQKMQILTNNTLNWKIVAHKVVNNMLDFGGRTCNRTL